jgi:hypothetical protein
MTGTATNNPDLQALLTEANGRTNQDMTYAGQKAWDTGTGVSKELAAGAGARGISGGAREHLLVENAQNTQANISQAKLNAEQAAMQQKAGITNAMASNLLQQQGLGLQTWQAQNQAALAAAQLAEQRRATDISYAAQMAGIQAGMINNMYSGFSGSSGSGYGQFPMYGIS